MAADEGRPAGEVDVAPPVDSAVARAGSADASSELAAESGVDPAAPLSRDPFLIRYSNRQVGEPKSGTLGQPHKSVRADDRIQVYLTFDAPLYFYLLRLDTDGTVELCWPESGSTSPEARQSFAWPTGASAFHAQDAGAQGFILIADSVQMSAFDVWHEDSITKDWTACEIKDPILYDGERFDFLIDERGGEVWRSEIPKPFGELCASVQAACPDQLVRAVCFAVD